ncbi:hypothetical protein QWI29_23300 [Mycolicibacterium neoaurum]|uniref:hypothetical protein n=1 Tax=Mycolicibacterium neoaurum TaxID=1795 RepID=UPI0026734FE2|nr:hypothetical protein [Mycolicibacterium neoaurum]MDO3402977.1 hypothetical protein [Mycolicibacterium neoaurum]
MIKYEWRSALTPAETTELSDMLSRAASYDAEPEYPTIQIADVLESMADPDSGARHLVLWMLPYATLLNEHDRPEQIAGLLRLVVGPDGTAEATLVIEPRLRSIGITTLLIERVGLDTAAPDGWLGTGARQITSWAQGNHPAAGRLSDRFLIPRTRRIWKLIGPATPAFAGAAPVVETITAAEVTALGWAGGLGAAPLHAVRSGDQIIGVARIDIDPVESEEFGSCATLTGYRVPPATPAAYRRDLLTATTDIAHREGRTGVIIYVDSDDRDWVNACRLSGFQHDRTDVRFQLGDQQ